MAVVYYAGIDTALFEDGFAVVVGGTYSGTATLATGTYSHVTLASITRSPVSGGYTALAAAVQTALQTVNAGFSCSFSTTTNAYTIAHADAFTLTWTGAAGLNLRRALGFSGTVSSTTSATSDVRPYYLIVPEINGRSMVSGVYEADDNVQEAVADGGDAFGVDRDTAELRSDWAQTMEPIEAVMARSATAAVPWTWQHFFAHLRMHEPFACADNGTTTVHQLRAEGASFSAATRERVTQDWDDIWNVRLLTRDLGAV